MHGRIDPDVEGNASLLDILPQRAEAAFQSASNGPVSAGPEEHTPWLISCLRCNLEPLAADEPDCVIVKADYMMEVVKDRGEYVVFRVSSLA